MELLWSTIILVGVVAAPALLVFLVRRAAGIHGTRARAQRTKELVARHSRERAFVCNFFEEIDTDLFQLYGQSLNTPLRPGMQVEIGAASYVISEVYADDDTPETADNEVASGVEDTPIVIRGIARSDVQHIREHLKSDVAIVLKLR